MATKKVRKLIVLDVPSQGQPVHDPAEAAANSGDYQGEAVVAEIPAVVLDGTLAVVKDKKTKAALVRAEKRMSAKATKSEVVKTKADTIDAEDKKTIAGKAQILDEAKVKEIIALSDEGKKPSEIAKLFGVAPSHISNIVRGVTWQHVTGRHYVKGAYKKAAKPAPAAKETAAKKPATTGKKATGTKKGGK